MTAKNKEILSIYIQCLMLRNGCGDSVYQFAKLIDVHYTQIYHWIKCDFAPSRDSIKKLQKFGADVEYIYELVGGV